MRKTSNGLTIPGLIRSWGHSTPLASDQDVQIPAAHQLQQPKSSLTPDEAKESNSRQANTRHANPPRNDHNPIDFAVRSSVKSKKNGPSQDTAVPLAPLPPPPRPGGEGAVESPDPPIEDQAEVEKLPIHKRFWNAFRMILFSSWLNVLLIFVPVAIVVANLHISPTIVFAMNAIAIIPLATLLSFATESVARRLGDTVGALMNVTFGNAVELIIFMYVKTLKGADQQEPGLLQQQPCVIALVKNEIRIVQASILGSILSNLLLILGMCFLLGGLRYREQIYNSAVTQMSACLLALSVMSLLLPTAFHASFDNNDQADRAVLQVSRGTSIILLVVYFLYLLFQLKSHAYMYESTPQNVIDEESHPGVLAGIMDSSDSTDSSSSSSSSDSDDSSRSHTTARKIKRAIQKRTRRKSTSSSKESAPQVLLRNDSAASGSEPPVRADEVAVSSLGSEHTLIQAQSAVASGDEADTDGEATRSKSSHVKFPDFESSKKSKKKKKKQKKGKTAEQPIDPEKRSVQIEEPKPEPNPPTKRPGPPEHTKSLGLRNFRPLVERTFSTALHPTQSTPVPPSTEPGLRRTTSLPDRLNRTPSAPIATSTRPLPFVMTTGDPKHEVAESKHISRTSAVILLVVSTALVALCAEYLVDSINYLVDNTGVSEAFVGLIILPIIGNAAEHVCAVTVAAKNKMDLAIGVAVGSSIQIALFVTPIVIIIGWILEKDMSLYFSLFETISLFVAAFIVNFLVLDGRSNYLEGALLCAAYIIVAVAAYFYPDSKHQSSIGGAPDLTASRLFRF